MTKLAWRRTWFQVHKWIGLMLAVLIVPLSLSGAALVWHDGLDRLVAPSRYAVTGAALLPVDRYVAAAHAVLKPGERVAQVTMPDAGDPVAVAAQTAGAAPARRGPPARTMVYLDPPTARVLQVAQSNAGVVRFLHVLHGSLQVPGAGRQIVGWIGVAMMVSCFTGLWLWWPTVGTWVKGLRWRRHRNTDSNLHHVMGFWVALPLFVLSLTGAWISFPGFFAALSGGAAARGPDRGAMLRAPALADPAQPVATVVGRATSVRGGAIRSIAWPTARTPDWTVTYADGGIVKVADDGGVAVAAAARQPGGIARLMRRIHDGQGMGIVWQLVIFVGGLLPAALAVTGIVMWWRARGWRAQVAATRSRGR